MYSIDMGRQNDTTIFNLRIVAEYIEFTLFWTKMGKNAVPLATHTIWNIHFRNLEVEFSPAQLADFLMSLKVRGYQILGPSDLGNPVIDLNDLNPRVRGSLSQRPEGVRRRPIDC